MKLTVENVADFCSCIDAIITVFFLCRFLNSPSVSSANTIIISGILWGAPISFHWLMKALFWLDGTFPKQLEMVIVASVEFWDALCCHIKAFGLTSPSTISMYHFWRSDFGGKDIPTNSGIPNHGTWYLILHPGCGTNNHLLFASSHRSTSLSTKMKKNSTFYHHSESIVSKNNFIHDMQHFLIKHVCSFYPPNLQDNQQLCCCLKSDVN